MASDAEALTPQEVDAALENMVAWSEGFGGIGADKAKRDAAILTRLRPFVIAAMDHFDAVEIWKRGYGDYLAAEGQVVKTGNAALDAFRLMIGGDDG